MNRLNNRGSVIIFVTLIITLLLAMVGIGLDTGMLTYVRSQAQPAVDAAALAAASGLIGGQSEVEKRVAAYNSTNDYVGQDVGQPGKKLGASNVMPISYDGSSIQVATYGTANGVRVGLEKAGTNPYNNANAESSVVSPLFLTPLLNLLGFTAPAQANLNITATAVLQHRPELPIAIVGCTVGDTTLTWSQTPSPTDNSAFTSFTYGTANVNLMRDLVSNTCSTMPPVAIGSCINLNNGQDTPVLKEIVKVFGPFSSPKPKDPEDCFLVPIIPDLPVGGNINKCRPMQGLARMCISEIKDKGSPKYVAGKITACYLNWGVSTCSVPVLVRDTPSGM